MAIDKQPGLRGLFFAVVFLAGLLSWPKAGPGSLLWAQSGVTTERRFIQRLSWTADANVLRYEVVIEEETGGVYREHLREITRESVLTVSLSPGRYRYRVIPYDFLDRPGPASQWVNIEVRPLLAPIVDDFSPTRLLLDTGTVHVLDVWGRNLSPDAEVFLRRLGGQPVTPQRKVIRADGRHAGLTFSNYQLVPGDYEIIVRNPGGLEASKAAVTVAFPEPEPVAPPEPEPEPVAVPEPEPVEPPVIHPEPVPCVPCEPTAAGEPADNPDEPAPIPDEHRKGPALYIAAGWTPLIRVFGKGNLYGDSPDAAPSMSPSGVGIRVGMASSKERSLNGGFEFAMSWHAVQAVEFDFSLLGRKRLGDRGLTAHYRLGAGFSVASFTAQENAVWVNSRHSPHLNAGASLCWPGMEHLYLETGLDYTHLFPASSGRLRPWLGIGMQY